MPRDLTAWVEQAVDDLDEMRELCLNPEAVPEVGRTRVRLYGAARIVKPEVEKVVRCIDKAAELLGLLGAAKRAPLERGKGEDASELPDDPAELIKLHEEKIAQLRAMLPAAAKETGGKDARH